MKRTGVFEYGIMRIFDDDILVSIALKNAKLFMVSYISNDNIVFLFIFQMKQFATLQTDFCPLLEKKFIKLVMKLL